MTAAGEGELCRCGHPREAHSHYRAGTECSVCPAGECPKFRPARGRLRALFGRR